MGNDIITLLQECDTLKARLSEMRPLPTEALEKIQISLSSFGKWKSKARTPF